MLVAINTWTLPSELAPQAQLDAAASAGFDGVELVLATDGPLRFDTPLHDCATLARRAADRKLQIVSLATGEFWRTNYATADSAERRRAIDLTLHMLDRAVVFEAGAILVVPAVVGTAQEARPRTSYADALHRTFDTLRSLRHEAESRGVTIALENVWNRFLLSPLEAADLLDGINSPHVGWYFDTGNIMALGYPEDWITTLGRRIRCVHVKDYDLDRPGSAGFCPLGEGSVDWPGVLAALRRVNYEGPLTFEGPGEPEEICRRLRELVADQPVEEGRKSP